MNIITEEFINDIMKYVKLLKLSIADKYVYLLNNDIYCVTEFGVKFITDSQRCNIGMIPIDLIKNHMSGYQCDIGILMQMNNIEHIQCLYRYQHDITNIYNVQKLKEKEPDIRLHNVNEDSNFYNNILLKKTDDGAGRYNIDDKHCIIVSPMMIPALKSSKIDLDIYDLTDTFACNFIIHKSSKLNVNMITYFLYI